MQSEGEGTVLRQGRNIGVVAFLIGCAVFVVADASGVQAQASNNGEARCEGTRKVNVNLPARFTTNDLPGCPPGGLLSGTDEPDLLAGEKGDDEIRGLGGSDDIMGGDGNDLLYGGAQGDGIGGYDGDDVIYGGPGNDGRSVILGGHGGDDVIYGGPGDDANLKGFGGKDVIYGGPGDDTKLDGSTIEFGVDGQRDELYCGEGRDSYWADKEDYVDGSCEVKLPNSLRFPKDVTTPIAAGGGQASGSAVPIATSGGPGILLPAVALLVGSGILTYAILRRR